MNEFLNEINFWKVYAMVKEFYPLIFPLLYSLFSLGFIMAISFYFFKNKKVYSLALGICMLPFYGAVFFGIGLFMLLTLFELFIDFNSAKLIWFFVLVVISKGILRVFNVFIQYFFSFFGYEIKFSNPIKEIFNSTESEATSNNVSDYVLKHSEVGDLNFKYFEDSKGNKYSYNNGDVGSLIASPVSNTLVETYGRTKAIEILEVLNNSVLEKK